MDITGQKLSEAKISELNDELKQRAVLLEVVHNKLIKSTNYLENLINYANAPIIVWDIEQNITKFNSAFGELIGREENEVLGKSIEILFPPKKLTNTMQLI
ncbi:MAG: PAS domain S-box protein [Peptostreptococcaceae bacterium]|nr:PAS domain S-box protein [Peptostreptococcaceae bacterium]